MGSYDLACIVNTFAGKKAPSFLPREVVQKSVLIKQTSMLQLRYDVLTVHYMNTGRLLTGPQITEEVCSAVDLAGLLITLGQTETWRKAPFAQGIALKLLLWKNKVGRLLKRPGGLWWQLIGKPHLILKIQKHRSLLLQCGLSQLSNLCSEMWGAWSPATMAQLLVQHWMGEV